MADQGNEFALLMERVRAGDNDALQEVCLRYGEHIRRIVRHKLDARLREQFDSHDFTQDVWASFVAVPRNHYTFETPEQLVLFLARMASNKMTDAWREQGALKRAANRLQVLVDEPPTRQPSASQLAIADERWEGLLTGLPPVQRQIVELLRLGHTHDEIAERLGVHKKAIQRLVNKLAERVNS